MTLPVMPVSVIIPTFNRGETVVRTIKGVLAVDYFKEYFEVIVVNDGSTDNTKELLEKDFGKNPQIRLIHFEKNQGVCRARNKAIKCAHYPIIVNLDHDCVPSKDWLENLVLPFALDSNVGMVTSYGGFGGTSTAFRKSVAKEVGGYDEDYFYYREDTDFAFKIIEAGYEFKSVKAEYFHDHTETQPKGIVALIKYVLQRAKYHQNDVLLYKKHPMLARAFLDIKFGIFVNPIKDFGLATGRWKGKGGFEASSPRGIKFIENKTPLHFVAIIGVGVAYAFLLKFSRLIGSVRFRKVLV